MQIILEKMALLSPVFYLILYMSILGGIVGIIAYFVRNIFDKKMSAKIKCIIWCVVLAVFLIPIRIEIPSNLTYSETGIVNRIENIKNIGSNDFIQENSTDQTKQNSKHNENSSHNEAVNSNTIPANKIPVQKLIINIVIPYLWLFVIILCFTVFITATLKIRKKVSKEEYKNSEVEQILAECKAQLNIKKNIKIVLQNNQKTPSIFGLLAPAILINDEILQKDKQTVKYILLHELSHFKRKDALLNYILLFTIFLHWFNPIIWFLFKIIRQDIELGADELACEKLNQDEKYQYALVLIQSLRVCDNKTGVSNLLCISDTEKNMKRRISMLKSKKRSIFLGILIAVILLTAVLCTVFLRSTDDETPSVAFPNATASDNVMHEDEKSAITDYVLQICNNNLNNRLPEFDDINQADKVWIYSHISRKNDKAYKSEEEIISDLQEVFGNELILDVAADTKNSDISMPQYDSAKDAYALPVFGMDNQTCYVINSISKSGKTYVANVVEYNISSDFDTNESIISAYDENTADHWKWHEIFRVSNSDDELTAGSVLDKKEQFQSFSLTLEKNDNGTFSVIKSEKV